MEGFYARVSARAPTEEGSACDAGQTYRKPDLKLSISSDSDSEEDNNQKSS